MLKRLASTEYSLTFIEYGIKPVRVRGARFAFGFGCVGVARVFSTFCEFSQKECPVPPRTRRVGPRTLTGHTTVSTLRLRHQHPPLHFHNSPFKMALIPGLSIFLMGPRLP
jgi:hypothetical protein